MKQLRLLREKENLTQSELAKKFQISSSTIAMYERGERKPDPDMLINFADFFNVSVDYLLGRESSFSCKVQKEKALLPSLQNDESEILDVYRQLDRRGQARMLTAGYEELERLKGGQAATSLTERSVG